MNSSHIKVLLIDETPECADIIGGMLTDVDGIVPGLSQISLKRGDILSAELDGIDEDASAVLLELQLDNSDYASALSSVHALSHSAPIIILSENSNQDLIRRAIQAGAQDYLVKGQFEKRDLVRSVWFTRERHRLIKELYNRSLYDELTGLYNAHSFSSFGEQHLKIATRAGREILMVHAVLEGLNFIITNYGVHQGNDTLAKAANIFRRTFRSSDIIARTGRNTFAALAIDVNNNTTDVISSRLKERLSIHNQGVGADLALSLTFGMAYFRPTTDLSIESMLAKAAESMTVYKDDVKIY
jgi:two-component system, cell cycle response regulator